MKTLNIKFFILFIFSLASILIIGNEKSLTKNITDSTITTVGYKYSLKEFNGKIAVFNYGETEPIQILECPLNSLPENEILLISGGINIKNEEELQNIIEAYD